LLQGVSKWEGLHGAQSSAIRQSAFPFAALMFIRAACSVRDPPDAQSALIGHSGRWSTATPARLSRQLADNSLVQIHLEDAAMESLSIFAVMPEQAIRSE
jgi:hypothetical protein